MDELRPELIIAIDFGMTCTGVAYANPSIGSDTIRWIQRWPGRMQANENKVPTVLVYPKNWLSPSSWGFLSETIAEQTGENKELQEWFKTLLDDKQLQQCQAATKNGLDTMITMDLVERWYCDYFRFLYQHIQSKLQMELASPWRDARIEFIFSVPTTWKPYPTVERFRTITERAGFGSSLKHKISIGLTEAEAAAVYMSRESPAIFKEQDILLVCDIGGGTTDLSSLRVNGVANSSLNLAQLDVVFGATLGAAAIDQDFESCVLERLEKSNAVSPMMIDLVDTAWEMMKSREYQNAKCDYGSPDDTDTFLVTIPRLARHYTNEACNIANGEMSFRRDELQILFDKQIMSLFELIDKQLTRMQQKFAHDQVSHLVLSGGLSNSLYLQKRLTARYAHGASSFANAANLQVRVAPDPQLVVCKGLVADRLAKLTKGESILGWRCCRASYGTICKVLYNPKNPLHLGQQTERDTTDGKVYIPNVVTWFIKQGEPVSIDYPIVRTFKRKLKFQHSSRVFSTSVIVSQLEKDQLPFTMNQNCSRLCEVLSDFSSLMPSSFKLKNRHFWNLGAKYYRVDYCIKVSLGPADICFELWFNGEKLSKDKPIHVEWHTAQEPAVSPIAPRDKLHTQYNVPIFKTVG